MTEQQVNPRILTDRESRAEEAYHVLSCAICVTPGSLEALSPEDAGAHIADVYRNIARAQDAKSWGLAMKEINLLEMVIKSLNEALAYADSHTRHEEHCTRYQLGTGHTDAWQCDCGRRVIWEALNPDAMAAMEGQHG